MMNSKTPKVVPIDARFEESLASLLREVHMGPNSLARYPQYDNESNRVLSFIFWPPYHRQQPRELAEAGFFSQGIGDRVTCFYCGKTLSNWQPEDEPWEEHARHSPRCQWLLQQKGKKFVGEITKKFNKSGDFVNLSNISIDGRVSLESEDYIKNVFAKNPNYCSERSRRESFTNWPNSHSQNPQKLVQAGFFSLGVGDHVKCFYCGVHLSNWERQDEPWEEHARHSPDCKWLLEQKGRRFIVNVRKKYLSSWKQLHEVLCSLEGNRFSPIINEITKTTLPRKDPLIFPLMIFSKMNEKYFNCEER
ncbi:E3 ubiquitin-protein ligase XIAP [Holothuria leucospilota]|uniref:E3 ubiquitin-protein ligase XIAP n=1 Tax=Holothuria leucospilota TaxID=206669 RepID=A0A9Q0YRG7_HOLLE|nr:E3 ubiquitin-protein ligase XIAP [Holothuria leucospilota]